MGTIQDKINWILQEKYNGKITKEAKKDIERFKKGEPLDYIIGFTNFLGCKIDLSKKPLIPRVETEFWVKKTIEEVSPLFNGRQNHGIMFLDMFAGSGCIGIAVAKHIAKSHVIFADLEENAVKQIKINCKINKIPKSRYKIIQSDIFGVIKTFSHSRECENVDANNLKFDYIFANPPYIPDYRNNPSMRLRTILRNRVQKSVLEYEPNKALFGGEDGLFYIKKFLAEAKNFLNKDGKIYMEFDSSQKTKIEKIILKNHYSDYQFHKDQYGKWRYVTIID